ncbi:glycine cleavage system aminomethyltransferase GcvT [Gorillibacterium massiliense]|uniref:glycine cleavage system aminomethyltransferase GcvT n=1 Tax=Gorillibacterium massiliense TaxID=1280390 RepID=UPI0004B630DE|nr:glycine cleavage system aminomethyltransferase GcvT [Gorillibacterium massiliense]
MGEKSELKRTPLFPEYTAFPEARCIDFGGWELPVQFSGIGKEHEAVRERAGLFDVSHMGEFIVTGQYAESFLQSVTTNNIARLSDGEAQYSLMCYPDGGTVDDLLVYRFTQDYYMLVVNAANLEKDWDWLREHLIGDVELKDVSEEMVLLALQGPEAEAVLSQLTDAPIGELKAFSFLPDVSVGEVPAILSRSGYTGEDGFELYVAAADAGRLWRALIAAGEPKGLLPCGLGARDTLRFEARLPLYGQELSSKISPLEAGLAPFVKLEKGEFIGWEALTKQKAEGVKRKLVGLELVDRGIPRAHYAVYADATGERKIGEVTTGTQSPTLKRNLGLALLDMEYAGLGTEVWVEIRGKLLLARVVKAPFYKRTHNNRTLAGKGERQS